MNLEAAIRVAEQIQEAEQQRRQQAEPALMAAQGSAPAGQPVGGSSDAPGCAMRRGGAEGVPAWTSARETAVRSGQARYNRDLTAATQPIQQQAQAGDEMTDVLLNLLEELSLTL